MQEEFSSMLANIGALDEESGRINKDALYANTDKVNLLCRTLAGSFLDDDVQVVVGVGMHGAILSQWFVHNFNDYRMAAKLFHKKAISLCVQQHEEVLYTASRYTQTQLRRVYLDTTDTPLLNGSDLYANDQIINRSSAFLFSETQTRLIRDKGVLVVADVLTPDGSTRMIIKAVCSSWGNVVGVGCISNPEGVTAATLGVRKINALLPVR